MGKKKKNKDKAERDSKKKGKSTEKSTPTIMPIHELEDLLRMVRRIARHEDELCTLTEAARKAAADDELLGDLRSLLEKMSEVDYNHEVNSVTLRLPEQLVTSSAKSKKPEKTRKTEKPAKTEKTDKTTKTKKPAKTDKLAKSEKPSGKKAKLK